MCWLNYSFHHSQWSCHVDSSKLFVCFLCGDNSHTVVLFSSNSHSCEYGSCPFGGCHPHSWDHLSFKAGVQLVTFRLAHPLCVSSWRKTISVLHACWVRGPLLSCPVLVLFFVQKTILQLPIIIILIKWTYMYYWCKPSKRIVKCSKNIN